MPAHCTRARFSQPPMSLGRKHYNLSLSLLLDTVAGEEKVVREPSLVVDKQAELVENQ